MPSRATTGLPTDDAASWRIGFGMEVYGSNEIKVGEVKFVGDSQFLVDRPLQRDIWVPFGACRAVELHRVILRVPADQVDGQGWPYADLGSKDAA